MNGQTIKDDRVIKPVQKDPGIKGEHGKAWRINHQRLLQRHNIPPEKDGRLASWLVEARWAHPIWHSYMMALIHLRPTADLPKPQIRLPEATHEFFLWATDPDADREAVIVGELDLKHIVLSPLNFGAQMKCDSDEAALCTIEYTIKDIVAGKLSPDTDHRACWEQRFGTSGYKEQYR
jgi:hypothetical protein